MKTAENRPNPLQTLAVRLQVALQNETLRKPPIQIRCGFKQGKLLVLAQHPTVLLDSRQLFAVLEQTLWQISWEAIAIVPSQQVLPVRLFLQVVGQQAIVQQPYASHTFWLDLDQTKIKTQVGNAESHENHDSAQALEPINQIVPFKSAIVLEPVADVLEPIADVSEAELLEPARPPALPPAMSLVQQFPKANPALLMAGILVGLAVAAGSFYILTRPCVIGECVPLQSAERLSQVALQTVESTASAQAVVNAYDQLVEANYLVSTVPPWSKQYAIAQTRLQTYTAQAESLEQIVLALQQAQTAAKRGQNPPHPLQEWQEIQALWQQAIAQLKQVPTDSPVYSLSRRKLVEYQANLTNLNQRIAIEQQAQSKVAIARDTARIAEAREGIATSLEAWQLTHATWQTVVNLLQQVPQSTMTRAEAQQLLAIYEPRLSAARNHHTQEEISAKFYHQALSLASQARRLEQQNQWSESSDQWQDALSNVQQVPLNTSYYSQAQSLVNAYTAAHTRSQEILRIAIVIQSTNADLSRTCAGTPKVCDYSFTDKSIRVTITADYDRAVEQTIARTQPTNNSNSQAAIAAHVDLLLRALAAIGENANMAIDLYNSDGSLFGSYVPEFSGYVTR